MNITSGSHTSLPAHGQPLSGHECSPPYYVPTVAEYRTALDGHYAQLLTAGGAATALLTALFLQQALMHARHTHKAYRRHVFWVISVFPVAVGTSTVALLIPRASDLCDAVDTIYMAIAVGRWVDLTLELYGGENAMAVALRGSSLPLSVPPVCCCMPCLPRPRVTKLRLALTKWAVWQLKWVQAAHYFVYYLIFFGFQDSAGRATPGADVAYYCVNSINLACYLAGLFALSILCRVSSAHLSRYGYRGKAMAVRLMIVVIKLQGAVIDSLGRLEVYPCVGPLISPLVVQCTLKNSLVVAEALVAGLFTWSVFCKPQFRHHPAAAAPTEETKVNLLCKAGYEAVGGEEGEVAEAV